MLRGDLVAIVNAALAAVEPGMLVERALRDRDARPNETYTVIAAVGKAAAAMAGGAVGILRNRPARGLIVTHVPVHTPMPGFDVLQGGHPLPTSESERAGRRLLETARAAGPEDHVLLLLSGGASALAAAPAGDVVLDEKRQATGALLRSGADIHAINTVRRHLSRIKGGWLAARSKARWHTLAMSDVVGDDPSDIGSGPTVGDPTSFADALAVLDRFGGRAAYGPSVVAHLEGGARGLFEETPCPRDPRLARSLASVIGGRGNAMAGAAEEARALGYDVVVLAEPVTGEARTAAADFAASAAAHTRDRRDQGRRTCVISSGETTVHVIGTGSGGRNQELALALAEQLPRLGDLVAAASIGTDGVDGPTTAAGAVVDSGSVARARRQGLVPEDYLRNNDSHAFFRALGDLIETGPTGTNAGDLQVLLLG